MNKTKVNRSYLLKIYKKYISELKVLTSKIRDDFTKLNKQRATFSDFDGELLYCLIRERKPEIFFEISPDCGYSSIYIASALSMNGKGTLYSFEVEEEKFKKKTEQLIKENLKNYSFRNHKIIIGDVTKTIPKKQEPDMVLIDSCHESWFANWYIKNLLDKIKDIVIIQDIVFYDRVEYSGESKTLMKFLNNRNFISLGLLERLESFREINNLFPRRRSYESNTLIYSRKVDVENFKPKIIDKLKNNFFDLNVNKQSIYEIENKLEQFPKRQNIHRTFLRLSRIENKHFYIKKSIAYAISELHYNEKPFLENLIFMIRYLHLNYFFKMILFKPDLFFKLLIQIYNLLKNKFK